MPDVYDWPPVTITAHEHTISRPGSTSRGLSGKPYLSQFQPTRRLVTAQVSGIGTDCASGGYVEALKHLLDGKLPLVRIRPFPRFWVGVAWDAGFWREPDYVTWTFGENATGWESAGEEVRWVEAGIIGNAGASGGWPYLDCTGFPAFQTVAVPAEIVTSDGVSAMVMRPAVSDANGNARLWLDTALASGEVTLGEPRRVFWIKEFPRAVQDGGDYAYTFEMEEQFESEFTEAFTYLNPWGTDA